MKKALAIVVAMTAAPAFAADLPIAGLSLDTEIKAEHTVDAGATTLTVNPELNWNPTVDGPVVLSMGTVITAFDSTQTGGFGDDIVLLDAWDSGNRPTIDFGLTYTPRENLELTAVTGWDVDASERTEITLGAAFSF